MGVKQILVQQIVATVKEDYLADICNFTKISINNTVDGVLTHIQENCGKLMPHKILERKDMGNNTT